MKKLVLFDWGGVLGHTGDMHVNPVHIFQEIGARMGIRGCYTPSFEDKVSAFFGISKEYSTLTTVSDAYSDAYVEKMLEFVYDMQPTYENILLFKRVYHSLCMEYEPNIELVKYAHSLKDRCSIGLISNCAVLEKYKQDVDVQRSKFDYCYISCDLGCRKPEPLIYNIANAGKEEIFFVDDREENLKYPKELGWTTYLFDGDNQRLINAIELFLQS